MEGFKCIRWIHDALDSPHNEPLRTRPGGMKTAGKAAGVVLMRAVIAVMDDDERYDSYQDCLRLHQGNVSVFKLTVVFNFFPTWLTTHKYAALAFPRSYQPNVNIEQTGGTTSWP